MKSIAVKVPDGRSGQWAVESFEMSRQASALTKLRASINGRPGDYCPPGKYKRLCRGHTIVMSNTLMEIDTHRELFAVARSLVQGRILLNGLGLGMALTALLEMKNVAHVTVVEKSPDVIKLVAPSFAQYGKRVTIIEDDAFTFQLAPREKFHAVWHDIWDAICSDNLTEMRTLTKKYRKLAMWQGCWGKSECLNAALRNY